MLRRTQRKVLQAQAGKKVSVCGVREFIDKETGEVQEFHLINVENGDMNFSKIWIGHILSLVDEIGNAKMRILLYILDNRNPQNMIVKTSKEIAKDTNTHVNTVNSTIKSLIKHDIIRRKPGTKGVLFLNPNVIFRGSHQQRMNVVISYHQLKQQQNSNNTQEQKAEEKQVIPFRF